MKIVLDRSYCDAALPFCARCSAAFFRKPLGTDRPCIVAIIDVILHVYPENTPS